METDVSKWRLRTAATLSNPTGIPYKLVEGYPKGTFEGGMSASVQEQYIIRMSDLADFAVLSFPPGTGSGADFTVYPHRRFPGLSALGTRKISWEGFPKGLPCDPWGVDPTAPAGTYAQYAIVTIDYTPMNGGMDPELPETYLQVSADYGGEVKVLSTRRANWDDPEGTDPEFVFDKVKFLPMTEWTVSWPVMPSAIAYYVLKRSRAYIGCVNSMSMPLFADNVETQAILFLGCSASEDVQWNSTVYDRTVALEMKFLEKYMVEDWGILGKQLRGAHNLDYNPETGKWEKLVDDDGRPTYPLENLNELFFWIDP